MELRAVVDVRKDHTGVSSWTKTITVCFMISFYVYQSVIEQKYIVCLFLIETEKHKQKDKRIFIEVNSLY